MIQDKKGFAIMILKIFVLVLIIVIVVVVAIQFIKSSNKTAISFIDKANGQLEPIGGSFIHSGMSPEHTTFWKFQFEDFILEAVETERFAQGQDYCYGTFFTDPDFEGLDGWSLIFLHERDNVIFRLRDNRGTLGAEFPKDKENNKLADKQLCVGIPDGTEEDVSQIVIKFGEGESFYYTEEGGAKKDFEYEPYHLRIKRELAIIPGVWEWDWGKADVAYLNVFFFAYNKNSNKLCLLPMSKSEKTGSLSHKDIDDLFSNAETGYPRYKAFCDLPEIAIKEVVDRINGKTCFYTPCGSFSSDQMEGEMRWELEKVKSLEETACGRFSIGCGGKCIPSNGISSKKRTFECKPCDDYKSCTDIGFDVSVCKAAKELCKMDCEYDWDDYKCIPEAAGGG